MLNFEYRPTNRLMSPAEVLAERQALQSGQQRNALMQLQLQDAQAEQADRVRRNALMQEFIGSIPSPQMAASQQALMGGGGPTVANAARMQPVDPRMQLLHQGMRAGAVDPMAYIGAAFPQPRAPERKVVGGALIEVGDGGVKELYRAPDAASKPPSSVQEYEFARQQGYRGTYEQWVTSKARAGAATTSVNYSAPVEAVDAQGNRVFIRTTKDSTEPVVIPGVRPPMSAAEERAASERQARERQARQMVSGLDDARSILDAGRATGSGVGNLIDAGARLFGQTTVGAQDAARLEALSGWLVANVPRMEGPQSNFDVQNYTTMAGKIGDRTVPIAERKAALKEVERLQRKYAEINGTPIPAPAAPAPAASGGWSIRPLGGK